MEYAYSVRVKIVSDKPLTREQLDTLFCYLELQIETSSDEYTNVRAEVTYAKPLNTKEN